MKWGGLRLSQSETITAACITQKAFWNNAFLLVFLEKEIFPRYA